MQDQLERFCNVPPDFGANGAKYDINLIESCLLPLYVNEQGIKPMVIKKANQFVHFKFGDVDLLDKLNFLRESTSVDSSLKALKLQRRKDFFRLKGSLIQKSSTVPTFS